MNQIHSPRRGHRKRISALRLSSDTANTTNTLPEYSSAGWKRTEDHLLDTEYDRPPDYPDSAEEADADTDDFDSEQDVYVRPPPPSLPTSPRRGLRRHQSHRRPPTNATDNDAVLDSLLERSVHALEMSNVLLQSSMSTQTSLTTILSSDSPVDRTLEARARGLSSRIRSNRAVHEDWADDLNEISRGVDTLYGNDDTSIRRGSATDYYREGSLSTSLPSTSSMPANRQNRRRPSLNTQKTIDGDVSQLRLEASDRNRFISPAPRALTQYIESTTDPDSMVLPSTLGLRSASSSHLPPRWQTPETSTTTGIHVSTSPPPSPNPPLEPSKPVINLLSSLVGRAPSDTSPTPSSSRLGTSLPSFSSFQRRGSGSASTSLERGSDTRSSGSRTQQSPEQSRQGRDRSRSTTPKRPKSSSSPPSHRTMTPCIEEQSSSSSSDAHPYGYRTMLSLRKILDEQRQQPSNGDTRKQGATSLERYRPPALLPSHSVPLSGTSSATASISRLYTKAIHSSSTRPPSPPLHSSLKRRSVTGTPVSAPPLMSISTPNLLSASAKTTAFGGSSPSSGRSTPKRISFAQLPESYASSRPAGSSSKFNDKKNRRKSVGGESGSSVLKGWKKDWMGWLMGAAGMSPGLATEVSRPEHRTEDRISRSWGSRAAIGVGLEDWSV